MKPTLSSIGFALLLVMFGVTTYFVYSLVNRPQVLPPLAYTQTVYQPERVVYAPGETVVYTAALTIERYGGVKLIRGWRTRPGAGRALLCNGEAVNTKNGGVIEDTPPPFQQSAVGNDVEGRVLVPVPDLPPGEYSIVSTVYKLDGGEAVTEVPVTIVRPCGGN